MTKKQKKRILEFIITIVILLGITFYEKINPNNTSTQLPKTDQIEQTTPAINTESASNLKIYFIDVGQADCILINNNGEYALIDAGNNADGQKIVDYINSLGISSFKYVIGTHAHEDHIGGMDDIIDNFSIEHFFMPDAITTTKTFEDVLDALDSKKITYETPETDSTFTLADSKFKVLYIGTDKKDLNDTSIVLKMTYKETSYLFMGDATNNVEKEILDKDLKSTVLKVGHHGSQYSSNAHFLKKVSPTYAIIQVGKNNNNGHPKKVVLDKLNALGTKIYRTDEDGTIILTSDGENINFETIKTDTNG